MTKRACAGVTLDATPGEVANALLQIMWSSRIRVKNQTFTEQPLTINLYGEHSASFRSWGEFIKITITTHDFSGSKVTAESEAKVPTTIFDYGQNKENLEIVLNQLIMKFRNTSALEIEEAVL
jgi:hypothetical protein